MAGTYRKLKNGKWELCVNLGTDLKGKRIRKYQYVEANGVRDVEKLLAEFVTECTKSDYNDGERMTLKDYSARWMADYAEKHLRIRTCDRYKSTLPRIYEALGHKKLGELKPTHLIQFYNMLSEDGIRKDGKKGGLSHETIKQHHAVLSSMFSTAVKWQLIKENICERVEPPQATREEKKKKSEKEDNIYTLEQTKELLSILLLNMDEGMKYRILSLLAIFTGFRRGELMGLDWNDVDLDNNTITVKKASLYTKEMGIFEDETKTHKSKRISYIPKFMTDLLKNYRTWWDSERTNAGDKWQNTDRLFIIWDGRPMHPDKISTWFPQFLEKNNLPKIRFHDLRHLHGSILWTMGMDLPSIADQMGHSNTQMLVNRYGHNIRKKSNEVAERLSDALLENGGVNGGVNKKYKPS